MGKPLVAQRAGPGVAPGREVELDVVRPEDLEPVEVTSEPEPELPPVDFTISTPETVTLPAAMFERMQAELAQAKAAVVNLEPRIGELERKLTADARTAVLLAVDLTAQRDAFRDRADAQALQIAKLQAALDSTVKPEEFMRIRPESGIFALGDADMYDAFWKTPSRAGSGWAVDFSGADAMHYAKQCSSNVTVLPDGVIRIVANSQTTAAAWQSTKVKLAAIAKHDLRVSATPLTATRLQAADACRETGIGVVQVTQAAAMLAIRSPQPIVIGLVRDAAGKPKELRIPLS